MNLYYKKKGKQKRVTQQATSQTDPNAIEKQAPSGGSQASTPDSTSSDLPPATQQTPADGSTPEKTAVAPSASSEPSAEAPATAQSEPTPASATEPSNKGAAASIGAATAAPVPKAEPSASVVQPKVDITVQFAKSKNWSSTPYGEWRDSSGSVVAVVSLSGEVAPIKSNDRDELKLFAEKQG
jgi:hypothetical protein